MKQPEENDLIDLREFLDSRLPLVREDYFARNKNLNELIKKDFDLPDAAFNNLENMCNPKLLNIDEFQREIKTIDDLDAENLSIIEFLRNAYPKNTKKIQPTEIKFMKNLAKLNELEPEEVEDHIETPDIVLSVQLSQPLSTKIRKLAWSEDFIVLGQNKLTDLKDKITCFRNEIKVGEFSKNPDQVRNASTMKELIKSGYFLIESTIYNDLRFDNNDCSLPVLKWAAENKLGHLETKRMEETRFIDLAVRLGFPYLYRHLGNCEHLLLFTSVKLLNPSTDCYVKSKYPLIKDKTRGRFTFCWCCNKIYAKWIVCNSQFAVDDPTFLCERCFRNTHYLDDEQIETEQKQTESNEQPKTNEEQMEVDSTQSTKANQHRKAFDFKAYHFSQL